MSKKIWVSRDEGHGYDLIWSTEPVKLHGHFGLDDTNYIAEGVYGDFFGVKPGECRRFVLIPDDDWIPVTDERKPEVGQVVWMTDLIDGKPYTVARLYLGGFGKQTVAWMPRVVEPEPYKPEGEA